MICNRNGDITHAINSHFVSPVSIGADHPRYSLSGWFYAKDKDGPRPENRLTV